MARGAYSYRQDPRVPAFKDDQPVVLFDGECALCSSTARTLLKHGPRFRLLASQSPLGQAVLSHYEIDPEDPSTMLVIADGEAITKSDGALYLARHLPFPYRFAVVGWVIPRVIRDWIYDRLAENRLKFKGQTWCSMPPSGVEVADRILD